MDGHNREFSRNPRSYMRKVAMHNGLSGEVLPTGPTAEINVKDAYESVSVDLRVLDSGVNSGTRCVSVHYLRKYPEYHWDKQLDKRHVPDGDDPLIGKFIPYEMEGMVSSSGAQIKPVLLPGDPGAGPKFVFTGAMNGCSFVIAEKSNGERYALHYPNSKGFDTGFPLLKGMGLRVVKSANYAQYGEDRSALEQLPSVCWGNAFCCAFFDDNDWWILCQPQLVSPVGGKSAFKGFSTKINQSKGLYVV
jgi:hypothetical protein